MTARLASGLWVSAYLARLQIAAIPAYVIRRGDATAGAVLVKLATLNGRAELWERRWDLATDRRLWERVQEAPEAEVDAALTRMQARDRDLWVIEVEDARGRSLLDEPGLDEG